MAKDISKMTVDQLKVLAYDTTIILQGHQNDLNVINSRIAMLLAPKAPEPIKPGPTGATGATGEKKENSKTEKP